jgi:predicted nuclease of predicted toxin-antitoxin system
LRFLVDQNVSHRVCPELQAAGHDVVHVQAVALHDVDDVQVFEFAARDRRIIITSDTDFGGLLAARRTSTPSVVLTREVSTLGAVELAQLLLANLDAVADELEAGAIVAFTQSGIRIRKLPLP